MQGRIVRAPLTKESWQKTWLTKKLSRQNDTGNRLEIQASNLLDNSKKKTKKSKSVWTVSGGLPETNRRTH
jgi:hypothetical protein